MITIFLEDTNKEMPLPAIDANYPREDVIESINNIASFAKFSLGMDRSVYIIEDDREIYRGKISEFEE